jgi:hypothetical protein
MRARHSQGGYLLLAMAALILMSTTIYLAGGLASQRVSGESAKYQALALRDARSALIAYAAMEDSTPGSLLCPDSNNNGDSDSANCASSIPEILGCLPWRTLGLAPGEFYNIERLWYVLTPEFRNTRPADERTLPARQINLDNFGALNLRDQSGGTTNIIAAVIAPGVAIAQQNRPNLSGCNTTNSPAYLEAAPIGGVLYSNASASGDVLQIPRSSVFNDHVLTITREELLRPVLRVVLEAFAAPAGNPNQFGLRKYFNTSGAKFTPMTLQTTAPFTPDYRQTSIMNRAADANLFDGSFDRSKYPSSPSLATGASNCNDVTSTAAGTTTKFPVSWLCYNNWYAYIEYRPTSSGNGAALYLNLSGPGSYGCSVNVDQSSPAAETVLCH